jgi:hypothetical protein
MFVRFWSASAGESLKRSCKQTAAYMRDMPRRTQIQAESFAKSFAERLAESSYRILYRILGRTGAAGHPTHKRTGGGEKRRLLALTAVPSSFKASSASQSLLI